MDILSPLANLAIEWSEDSCDWPGGISLSRVVQLLDKIYFGVTSEGTEKPAKSIGELHSTTDRSSWTTLTVPAGIKYLV